ncbi:protein kinase C delta type-like [Pseudophryne corroboree]|uniref:protein kinase C delta type-like n=1 Tax=Pseudophryne corroboree TaxID=495146 RepID=UPI00308172D2
MEELPKKEFSGSPWDGGHEKELKGRSPQVKIQEEDVRSPGKAAAMALFLSDDKTWKRIGERKHEKKHGNPETRDRKERSAEENRTEEESRQAGPTQQLERFWRVKDRRNADITEDPGEGCSHWAGPNTLSAKKITRKGSRRNWDRIVAFLKNKKNQFITAFRRGRPGATHTSQQNTDTAPLTVDKLIFHSILGEGGYGKVLLATDALRRERVAIKILKKTALIENEGSLVEFRVLQLTHQSNFLTHGYAAFQTHRYLYCVMELASGGDLFKFFFETSEMDLPTITFIAAELVCGLQFMHSKGIIHRDIKMENVLLTADGHLKITDFGLALMNVYGVTDNAGCCGTPGYTAPEIITCQPYSAAVDWFAFGVILYMLATGSEPFPGESVSDIAAMIIAEEPSYEGLTDGVTKDFLSNLLRKDQFLRLGVNGNVREHPFFSSINWEEVESGKTASPLTVLKNAMDLDKQNIPVPHSDIFRQPIPAMDQGLFDNIQFNLNAGAKQGRIWWYFTLKY